MSTSCMPNPSLLFTEAGTLLKLPLASANIPNVFFDACNDPGALHTHNHVCVNDAVDI